MGDRLDGRSEVFERLLRETPKIGESDDTGLQIRAVLTPLIERILERTDDAETIPADPSTCPNCGGPADSDRSPYCSPFCRDQAAFVRQFRGAVADESIFNPDRQMGMGQTLWSLQGGGYPHRQQLVPAKVMAKVIERDGGVCMVCGAPATGIDHTGSG